MEARADARHPVELAGIPPAVGAIVDRLAASGHAAYLVGGCVRDCLRGVGCGDFDIATSASAEAVLGLFPRAVPIGLRHGTVMIPSAAGPVDVTSFRAGGTLEADLAHRDFTINAMAYALRRRELIDPFDGRTDLAKGRLRAVGAAEERFAEDPLRALRAARLAATLELEVDPAVERAMRAAVPLLEGVARERIRRELAGALMAPGAACALALLRRTGLEERLAPGAAPDAPAVVEALPFELELRLAAWLRGARAGRILRRLRFPRRSAELVEHLLRLHPIEVGTKPERDAAVRRLARRAGERNLPGLIALRRAELAAGSVPGAAAVEARLRELEAALERVHRAGALALRRFDLALGGREVMEHLGCGPGPLVGRALAHLTERVVEDPACNTPSALLALLDAWASERALRRGRA
jgi:tRNA nucleotidyltransferase (CCA-adding enzyme)